MSPQARIHRFHVEDLTGQEVALSAGEAHHALHVLRLSRGAQVELFDGQGRRARGSIAQTSRGAVRVQVDRRLPPADRPEPMMHLAFAVPKGKRLDWLLEKATELGVALLRPIIFERSVAGGEKLTAAKRARWLAHCIAAAKQCGLDFLPEIAPAARLNELIREPAEGLRLLGQSDPEANLILDALAGWVAGRPIWLLVGPEGGLTERETTDATEAGFRPVRLGCTTLRVETAAVALVAATIAVLGS